MNPLLERLRTFLKTRSPRERWILTGAACVVAALLVDVLIASPLRGALDAAEQQRTTLETDLERSRRMAAQLVELRQRLTAVEKRIRPGEKTNLFTLLEGLADEAQIKDQLESIKPKQPSGNARFPETRVEVSIKGATLKQTVEFLYKIESAPVLLIVRSLRVKTRSDESQLLDVSFSVSSFERAGA